MDKFIFFKNHFTDISAGNDTIEQFSSLFHIRKYNDKDFVINEGEMNNSISFISEGILRSFILDYDGNEATIWFTEPGNFVKGSFANNVPSNVNIQCIGDCQLLLADWQKVISLAFSNPELRDYFNKKLAYGNMKQIELMSNLIRLDAKERYLLFREKYPHLLEKIPHYLIANHLGISPVQLSRIRKKLREKP